MLQAAYKQIDFAALENDIRETQAVCALTQSPLVFGHNDLLSGNILVLQQQGFDPQAPDMDGPLCFIDYEVGSQVVASQWLMVSMCGAVKITTIT